MGRGTRMLPMFCPNRTSTRVRVQSLQIGTMTTSTAAGSARYENQGVVSGRRIMVVVDASTEAKAALRWALSHAVQSHDTIILLVVIKPSPHVGDQYDKERSAKSHEVLYAMTRFCQQRKPEVKVEVSLVEGKERGPVIVNESERQGASLLVLGHRKRSVTWRRLMMWAGSKGGKGGVVDYCIKNASCMTLAVRRKGRRGGGYLITSRRHKDFWLLA